MFIGLISPPQLTQDGCLQEGGPKFSKRVRHGGRDDRGRREQPLRRQVRGLPTTRWREWPLADYHLLVHLDRGRLGLNFNILTAGWIQKKLNHFRHENLFFSEAKLSSFF